MIRCDRVFRTSAGTIFKAITMTHHCSKSGSRPKSSRGMVAMGIGIVAGFAFLFGLYFGLNS